MKDKACTGKVIFSFSCSANANPGVTSYQLFENETAILNTSDPGMWSGALKSEGIFVYKCVANNSLGSEYSMNVTVTVNGKQISPFVLVWEQFEKLYTLRQHLHERTDTRLSKR